MKTRLDLIGIVVADMARSLAFYRRLGLKISPDADGEPHVETTLPGGLRLAWDNLTGHHSGELVAWLLERGVWPLYTPLGGSWLNLAEGPPAHPGPPGAGRAAPRRAAEVAGWNADPTRSEWDGARAARRQRTRERRHALGGAGGYTRRPIPRPRHPRYDRPLPNGYVHII